MLFRSSSILAVQEDDTPLTKSIKVSILGYLKEKFADPETNKLLDMASLMDPRFKTTYIAEEKIEDIKLRAMAEMEKMLPDQGDMGHCDLLSLQSRELALPPPRHQGAPLQHQPLPCYPAHLTFLLRGLGSHGGGGRSVCCRLLPPLQDPDPTLPTLVLWTARSWALWAVGSPP